MVTLSFLTDEARDRAKQYRESRYEDERSKNDRRSLVFGSLDDVLSGTTYHHGLESKKSDSSMMKGERLGGSLHTRSAPGTPIQSNGGTTKRRFQRRSSCTIYNLAATAHPTTNSSNNKSEQQITQSPSSHVQTRRKSRSMSLSHRSKFQNSTENSSQQQEPRTIDERPIPLRNSSHHHHDDVLKSPMKHKQTMMDSNNEDNVSIVSFGDDDHNMLTIDQRPLPLKEIRVVDDDTAGTGGAPTTPSSHRQRRTLQSYGPRSAPTTRRPWLPKSPGSLSKHNNTTRRLSSSNSAAKLLVSPTSTRQRGSSSSNNNNPASPVFAPASPPLGGFNENNKSPGSQHSRICPSPPAKKLKSPNNRTPTTSSRARRNSSSRRKSTKGALPSALPLSSDHEGSSSNKNNNNEFNCPDRVSLSPGNSTRSTTMRTSSSPRKIHKQSSASGGMTSSRTTTSPGKNKKRSLSKRAAAAKGIDLDNFFGNNQ